MNKKLIYVLILICLTSFGKVFSQTTPPISPTEFTESARSRATAGQFESDSDYVIVDDIFLIERAFFSAGYQPALTVGQGDSVGNMTGFWAMPINENMTVGIAGEYEMDATRRERFNLPSTTVPNGIFTESILNENSAFNIRPVFRFRDFAFSYRIYRSGERIDENERTTIIPGGTEIETFTSIDSSSDWEHEIGFSWNTDMFNLYIPVGTIINVSENNSERFDGTGAPNLSTTTITETLNDTQAFLYINPEVTFPIAIGPITEIEAGLKFHVAVYNPAGASENITTHEGDSITGTAIREERTIVSVEDQNDVGVGVFVQPTMEWKTWEDKIGFILEPAFGIDYRHINEGIDTRTETTILADGTETETITGPSRSIYTNMVTPYLEASIGTIIKPVDWFEFRAGLYYGFNWENRTTTTSYEIQDGGRISTYDYDFTSKFEIYSGFGFIFGEDFFLDVYIAAGNFADRDGFDNSANDPSGDEVYNLFDIRNYGVQLSYRF